MASTLIRVVAALFVALVVSGCQSAETRGSHSLSADTGVADNKPYFVEFRSRYALSYGHTFVVFGRMAPNGRVISQEITGLAPKSADPNVYVAGHFIPVESSIGPTDGDNEKQYMTAYWRVRLTAQQYNALVPKIRNLQANHKVWTATFYNCNAFAGDIAGFLGYKKPFHLLRPRDYVDSLRRMNAKPGDAYWTSPSEKPAGAQGNSV